MKTQTSAFKNLLGGEEPATCSLAPQKKNLQIFIFNLGYWVQITMEQNSSPQPHRDALRK